MAMFETNDPITRVHEGMRVVDARGQEVGRVQYVQMGDPEAITSAGNEGSIRAESYRVDPC